MNNDFLFEPLTKAHVRTEFSRGTPDLDSYPRERASQDMKRRLSSVFVLRKANDAHVIGYFTLCPTALALTELPPSVAKDVGVYRQVPAYLIGRLALDTRYQGQRLGQRLLLNALNRSFCGFVVAVREIVHAHASIVPTHLEVRRAGLPDTGAYRS
jgi:ribosomal protein S18 acetylase RimI-like enzyme